MKKLVLVFTVAIILTFGVTAFGDSPLSSTDFYRAYSDVETVHYAIKTGYVDQRIADYIKNKDIRLEFKIAAINAIYLSGDNVLERIGNADKYLKLAHNMTLADIGKDKTKYAHFGAKETICLGYMMAMDDIGVGRYKTGEEYYKHPTLHPLEIINIRRDPQIREYDANFCRNLIEGLIHAQYETYDKDFYWGTNYLWVPVAKVMYGVNVIINGYPYEKEYTVDMRPTAASIIYNYMKLYCPEEDERGTCNPFEKNATLTTLITNNGFNTLTERVYTFYDDYFDNYPGEISEVITKDEFRRLVYGDSGSNTDEYKELIDKVNKEWEEKETEENKEDDLFERWRKNKIEKLINNKEVEEIKELMNYPEYIKIIANNPYLKAAIENILAEEAEKEAKNNSKFKDTDNHWAKDSIEEVAELGIMTGKGDDKFDPNAPVTRGELAVIILRLIEFIRQLISQLLS